MGFSHSTYTFFGVHVPSDQWETVLPWYEGERLDPILERERKRDDRLRGIGHLSAGDYDRDMFFLCASAEGQSVEVALGDYLRCSFPDVNTAQRWSEGLQLAALLAGYSGLEAPAWITVPDIS